MSESRYPPGWDEHRVRQLLDFYESQTELEGIAEDEAAFETESETTMRVPTELVPAVLELIAKHRPK